MNNVKRTNGFTLIEVIVVIAIIGILAALLVPAMMGYLERAHNAADLTNIHNLMNAVNNAYAFDEDEGFYDNIWGYKNNPSNKDMGYIYVDSDEVRTSNYAIAKMLEEMGYISDYEHPDKLRGSVNEPCYTIRGNSRLRCQSKIKWCRYQINFRKAPNSDEIEWGITCATSSTSSERFHNGPCDVNATKQMADRVGVQPYYKDLGGLK